MAEEHKPEARGAQRKTVDTFVPPEELLDMEALLAPIPGDEPCGEDVRYDPVYDAIRDARRSDDPSLPQGVWETDLKRADWGQVKRLGIEALTSRTKDLQIASWLLEALVQIDHFSGLSAGIELVRGLTMSYWEGIYPPLDEDDIELRISPFRWMNEKLSISVKLMPITQPQSIDTKPYSFADWESANFLEQVARRDREAFGKAEAQGKVTRAKFLGSVMFTSAGYYKHAAAEVGRAMASLSELEAFLDEKCGVDSPSLIQLRETLTAMKQVVEKLYVEKNGESEPEAEEVAMSETETQQLPDGEPVPSGAGGIRSRAQAYRMLADAADYLMMTEPHSPTPYLVKRAVSWGSLTLTELLEEIVANRHDLDNIFVLLGLKKAKKGGEEGA